MAKRLMILVGMLTVLLAATVPAFAQQEKEDAPEKTPAAEKEAPVAKKIEPATKVEPAPETEPPPEEEVAEDPGPAPDRTATFSFALTVEGDPPAGTQFFGAVPAEGCISEPLTDPDGDGVYTGSIDVPRFPPGPAPPPDAEPVSLPVQIVRADGGTSPCDPTEVIRDFGTVPANDETFSASASFDGEDPDPGEEVAATGTISEIADYPGASHGIRDEASGVEYFLTSDSVDLQDYAVSRERVTVYGTPVSNQSAGGTILNVTRVEPAGRHDEETSATGIIERLAPGEDSFCNSSTHAITDEASGVQYDLTSESVDLEDYAGERVTVHGTPLASPAVVGAERCPDLEVTRVRPAGEPTEETVTVSFELTVEGDEPPEDATFFGYLGYEPAPFRLTDPDGDGTYTGSTPPGLVPEGDTQPALIVQGTGTRQSQVVGPSPGEPISTIEDFGEVTFEDDTTLRANVSFGNNGGGLGVIIGGGSGGNPGSGLLSGVTGGIGVTSGIAGGLLPATGGMTLTVLFAGVLLVGGGLYIRRLVR